MSEIIADTGAKPRRLVRLSEAWDRLGIKSSRGYALLREGALPAVRFGKYTMIPEAALDAFIDGLPPAKDAPAPTASTRPRLPLPQRE